MVASVVLAALWGASLGVSQDAAPDFVTLGTVRIGGTDVPMRVPSGKNETFEGNYFEWHEGKGFETDAAGNRINLWRYVVDDEGRPVDRVLETGGWKDVVALYRRAQPNLEKAPEWRIKVVVLARTVTVNVDQNGVCVPRRGFLDAEEIAGIDPSDMVRGAAYRRMIESGSEASRQLGLAGLDDPSHAVRSQTAGGLERLPIELRRTAVLKALHDPYPRVIELGAMMAEGLSLSWSEVADLADSPDPAHERAILILMSRRTLPLDSERLDRLKSSPWPRTQRYARDFRVLGGGE